MAVISVHAAYSIFIMHLWVSSHQHDVTGTVPCICSRRSVGGLYCRQELKNWN